MNKSVLWVEISLQFQVDFVNDLRRAGAFKIKFNHLSLFQLFPLNLELLEIFKICQSIFISLSCNPTPAEVQMRLHNDGFTSECTGRF